MSNTSSPLQSTRQKSALLPTIASPERLLRALNSSPFKTTIAVLDIGDAHAKSNSDQLGPLTTLQRTASETEFEEKIAEAEATARSKRHSDIDDDQSDQKQRIRYRYLSSHPSRNGHAWRADLR